MTHGSQTNAAAINVTLSHAEGKGQVFQSGPRAGPDEPHKLNVCFAALVRASTVKDKLCSSHVDMSEKLT